MSLHVQFLLPETPFPSSDWPLYHILPNQSPTWLDLLFRLAFSYRGKTLHGIIIVHKLSEGKGLRSVELISPRNPGQYPALLQDFVEWVGIRLTANGCDYLHEYEADFLQGNTSWVSSLTWYAIFFFLITSEYNKAQCLLAILVLLECGAVTRAPGTDISDSVNWSTSPRLLYTCDCPALSWTAEL